MRGVHPTQKSLLENKSQRLFYIYLIERFFGSRSQKVASKSQRKIVVVRQFSMVISIMTLADAIKFALKSTPFFFVVFALWIFSALFSWNEELYRRQPQHRKSVYFISAIIALVSFSLMNNAIFSTRPRVQVYLLSSANLIF